MLEARLAFEFFRPWPVECLGYDDGAKGGRPHFDPVAMLQALTLQAQHNLSDARMEFRSLGACCATACRLTDPRPAGRGF